MAERKIDHEQTDCIVCPHCGFADEDSWEYKTDDGEAECPECGLPFEYTRNISVDYTTYKIERSEPRA